MVGAMGTPPTTVLVPPSPPGRRRVPVVVLELLGYTGAAAALSATGVVFETPSVTEQVVIGAIVALALIVAGWLVGSRSDELHRMRGVFWFVAVLSWLTVVAVLVGPDGLDLEGKWIVVVGAAAAAALAVPLWVREHRSLQLVAAFVSVTVMLAALVYTTETISFFGFEQEAPVLRWSALVLALIGVAGLVLGVREMVRPRRTAMVLGALAFLAGLPVVFADVTDLATGDASDLPTWVALAAGAVVLVIGSRTAVVAVTGLGIVQIGGSVVQIVNANIHETAPAIVMLIVGLVMLGGVVVLARTAQEGGGTPVVAAEDRPPPPPPPPPSPDPG